MLDHEPHRKPRSSKYAWLPIIFAPVLPAAAGLCAELSPVPTGIYRSVTETEITAELTLLDDGTAQYVVTWLNGEATEVLQQYSESGLWERRGNVVVVTLPPLEATKEAGRIEYDYSPCLSHRSFGGSGCSPGLDIAATNMPKGYTWALWRVDASNL